MRLRVLLLTAVALAVLPGIANAQVSRSTVVTPRVMSPDTPRFHRFTVDDTVTTCTIPKAKKRIGRTAIKPRIPCQPEQGS